MEYFTNPDEISALALRVIQNVGADKRLKSRESSRLEFKENFSNAALVRYAKTMAAFANNQGGIIIFGVGNSPRKPIGIAKSTFEELDPQEIDKLLKQYFAPKIEWDMASFTKGGKYYGVIAAYEAVDKPIICSASNDRESLRQGVIYYRYSANTSAINYSELAKILNEIKEKERKALLEQVKKIELAGPSNTAVLNIKTGVVSGRHDTFIIDQGLLPKISFIKRGNFKKAGRPTLKLIGDVVPVSGFEVKPTRNPEAPEVRLNDTEFKRLYPLTFEDLKAALKKYNKKFKADGRFHAIKEKLRSDLQYANVRYLDPDNLSSSKRWFYNSAMLRELKKHYKQPRGKPR